MTVRNWEGEPRDDISAPPGREVLWAVTVREPRTRYVRARTAFAAAAECGATLGAAEVRRASEAELSP
jgi:hypothetical protein